MTANLVSDADLNCDQLQPLYQSNLVAIDKHTDEQLAADARNPRVIGLAVVGGVGVMMQLQRAFEESQRMSNAFIKRYRTLEGYSQEKNCAPLEPSMDNFIAANSAKYNAQVAAWKEERLAQAKLEATFKRSDDGPRRSPRTKGPECQS